jgi:hypothetical protein
MLSLGNLAGFGSCILTTDGFKAPVENAGALIFCRWTAGKGQRFP